MKVIQKCNLRVLGMFFNNIEKKTHFEESSSSHTSLRDGHATQSDEFLERFQTAVDPHRPFLWKSYVCISYYLALVHPCIYSRGGRRTFGFFPKIHPIW